MSNLAQVEELVNRFHEHRDSYYSGNYNETQVRVEYIDPLFQALGWDIHNSQGLAEAYKDVIHEAALKIGDSTEAPDYCFRIGGARKFFLEAKKPAVNIKAAIAPAFQLRRYAWSAKLPLSILTDFEEFAVYDCRIKPHQGDKPSIGRVMYVRYDQYLERWDDIYGVFSKEAILKGSFDKFVESNKKKQGTAEVDEAFLQDIASWRTLLAKNIALRNPNLSERELNFSVQQTIDRIVFLRICEDRGIEHYGRLQTLLSGEEIYSRLTNIFRDADDRYNSGLFHFREEKLRHAKPDQLTLALHIDDGVLKKILKTLYYPESPYEFSVLSADILGQVYEQFLGKVIRLTAGHQAKIEDKPEVRKAGGVYYTPQHIVRYIVDKALTPLLHNATPRRISSLRVLDPACGSGSFLLQAYQYLLDWHQEWYSTHQPERHAKGKRPAIYLARHNEWRLSTYERKRILLNNIFGVDIDAQAVEVTKLSLLLRVLEGESDQSLNTTLSMFKERALPDLQNNIQCGNSIIESNFFAGTQISLLADEQNYRINAFDWQRAFPDVFKDGGFSCVIGNPPYIDSEWMVKFIPDFRTYCTKHYASAHGNWDVFCIFIERAIQLSKPGALASMIVPNKLGSADYAAGARAVIEKQTSLLRVADFTSVRVFPVNVYPIIWVAQKGKAPKNHTVVYERYADAGTLEPKVAVEKKLTYSEYFGDSKTPWRIFSDLHSATLLRKIEESALPLKEIATVLGAATVNEAYELVPLLSESSRSSTHTMKVINSGTIDRYTSLWGLKKMRYLKQSYLRPIVNRSNEQSLPSKRRAQAQTAKIIVAGMTKHLECFLDQRGEYLAAKSTTIVVASEGLLLLTGILNSKLMNYYYHNVFGGQRMQGGYLRVGPPQIVGLPIPHRTGDNNRNTRSITVSTNIEDAVDQISQAYAQLSNKKTPHEISVAEQRIELLEKRVDQHVYDLYGLTSAEFDVIEAWHSESCPEPRSADPSA